MSDASRPGEADGRHRLTGFEQALREPAIAWLGAEEVPRAHHDHFAALAGCGLQALLQFDADGALGGWRVLWRVFAQHGEGIGAVVVDVAGQHDGRAECRRRRNGVG
ncbi:hypothetical protein D3C78_1340860 [compost metagenome]